MTPISVVIITYNEAHNIGRCIESVLSIADEVLVVDSFSKDDTCAIASALGAKVIQHPFEGHIQQKNYAITQAHYPHILSLDADECLSEPLRQSIQEAKANWTVTGYSFNRLSNYCGHWVRHGGWYPDVKLRLWDSRCGQWTGQNPHDYFKLSEGHAVHIPGDLLHYTFYTMEEHRKQIESFTDIAAQAMFAKGKNASVFKAASSAFFKFIRDFVLRRGFMDGVAGWHIARLSAKAKWMKYRKLQSLNQAS